MCLTLFLKILINMDFVVDKRYNKSTDTTKWVTSPINLSCDVTLCWEKWFTGRIDETIREDYFCIIAVSQRKVDISSDHILFLVDAELVKLKLDVLPWRIIDEIGRLCGEARIPDDFLRKLSTAKKIKLVLSSDLKVECDVLSQYARAGLYFLSNCKEYEAEATAFAVGLFLGMNKY